MRYQVCLIGFWLTSPSVGHHPHKCIYEGEECGSNPQWVICDRDRKEGVDMFSSYYFFDLLNFFIKSSFRRFNISV